MHILSFSTLYPTPANPAFGVFVHNRLQAYRQAYPHDALRIMAPQRYWPRWPQQQNNVLRPCWYPLPKTAAYTAVPLLQWCFARALRRYIAQYGRPQVIDAHYLFPDAVAAIAVGRRFNIPVVATARGSDVTYWPQHPAAMRALTAALPHAAHIITVCDALRHHMHTLWPHLPHITTLRNGVDGAQFYPVLDAERAALRTQYNMQSGVHLLSVGHLIARKGHDLLIQALEFLPPQVHVHIVGHGAMAAQLQQLAKPFGTRVIFYNSVPPSQIPSLYNAANALVLASHNEGMANVLLEAQACGTPVIACAVDGTPEVVQPPLGTLFSLQNRTPQGIAAAVLQYMAQPAPRAQVAAYGQSLTWHSTTQGMRQIFSQIIQQHRYQSRLLALQWF